MLRGEHPKRDQERLLAWLARVLRFPDARSLLHWLKGALVHCAVSQCGSDAPSSRRPLLSFKQCVARRVHAQVRMTLAADFAAAVAALAAAWQADVSAVEGLLLGLAPAEALLLCTVGSVASHL